MSETLYMRETDRQTDRQRQKQRDRETDRQTYGRTDGQTERQTDRDRDTVEWGRAGGGGGSCTKCENLKREVFSTVSNRRYGNSFPTWGP